MCGCVSLCEIKCGEIKRYTREVTPEQKARNSWQTKRTRRPLVVPFRSQVFFLFCCRSIKFIKCCVWGFNNLLFSCPLCCGLCFLFVVAVEKKADTHHILICYVAANIHTHTHTRTGRDTRAIDKYTSIEREISFFNRRERER